DSPLIHQMAVIIGTEGRAKHDQAVRAGRRDIMEGLDFWSPNINIFRDPRWGRGQETYGEDPYLTGRMGVAFVTGLQGDDPYYFRVIATPKHYVVHSGPESTMCAYNRVNGEPACANPFLLEHTFRNEWKFNGYVVSDCDAVADIYNGHHFTRSLAEAGAVSLKTGMDNECADFFTKAKDNSDYVKF